MSNFDLLCKTWIRLTEMYPDGLSVEDLLSRHDIYVFYDSVTVNKIKYVFSHQFVRFIFLYEIVFIRALVTEDFLRLNFEKLDEEVNEDNAYIWFYRELEIPSILGGV